MSNNYLTQGIAAAKAGQSQKARQLLSSAIQQDPNDERGWGWFYNVAANDVERLQCLKEVVRINPNNERAKQLLQALNARQIGTIWENSPQDPRTNPLNQENSKSISAPKATKKKNYSWIFLGGGFLLLIGLMVIILLVIFSTPSNFMTAIAPIQIPPTPTQVPPTSTPVTGSISGMISWQTLGEGNVLVIGVTVKVWDATGNTEIQRTITDSNGKYEADGLPPGKYLVSVYQAASTVGTMIAEKCWVFENVVVNPAQTTKLFMDFSNSATHYYPQCAEGQGSPPSSSTQG